MDISEKAAYAKGLADGLNLDENDGTVKVVKALLDLVDDMAQEINDLEYAYDELCDQLDAVDADLADLEEDYYEEFDDEDFDDDFDDEDFENETYYEVTCPSCGETTCVGEEILLTGGIDCPKCGESLEFDFDGLIDEDDEEE